MRQVTERKVEIGFRKEPRKVLQSIEKTIRAMEKKGWLFQEACIEDSLGYVHLFFERNVSMQ